MLCRLFQRVPQLLADSCVRLVRLPRLGLNRVPLAGVPGNRGEFTMGARAIYLILKLKGKSGFGERGRYKRFVQRTVELIDEYRARAQEQGVAIRLLVNPASGQVLVKVEPRNP